MPPTLVIFGNELHRRALDRSAVITAVVAPLVLAAILGLAFGGSAGTAHLRIGVSGGAPATVDAGVATAQLPAGIDVVWVDGSAALRRQVASGLLAGGVEVHPVPARPSQLLRPALAPSTGRVGPGFTVLGTASATGTAAAAQLAAAIADREYAGVLVHRLAPGHGPTPAAETATAVGLTTVPLGTGGGHVLDFFAPSVAVLFLFMGAGLGTRSLLVERSQGTLVRLAAAPVRPASVVAGKLLAIVTASLISILTVWAVTTVVFGADWGQPLGVLMMCVGSVLAMCGVAVFLTSFARDEQEAFGVSMLLGLVLALLGGNLLPPGALPPFLQLLSLGTPNGWTVVGFGRLGLEGAGASAVLGPFLVLCAIGAGFGAVAATRVRRMVTP